MEIIAKCKVLTNELVMKTPFLRSWKIQILLLRTRSKQMLVNKTLGDGFWFARVKESWPLVAWLRDFASDHLHTTGIHQPVRICGWPDSRRRKLLVDRSKRAKCISIISISQSLFGVSSSCPDQSVLRIAKVYPVPPLRCKPQPRYCLWLEALVVKARPVIPDVRESKHM